jgi:hypothetical protein
MNTIAGFGNSQLDLRQSERDRDLSKMRSSDAPRGPLATVQNAVRRL